MSSPRTEPTDRSPAPAEPPKKILSPVQIAAGALASVSAAVVASFFGVAGTLIGAAVASVISTVSAALYTNSLTRTNEQLRRVRSQRAGAPPVPGTRTAEAPAADPPATRVLPADLDPRRAPAPRSRPRWPRMAGYAVAVFALAMAIVTGIEVVGQQPVSALVGPREASSSTTLGSLADDSSSRDTGTPTPSAPSTAPTPESGAPEEPESDPSAPAPTPDSAEETATPTEDDGAPQTQTQTEQEAEQPGTSGGAATAP